MKNNPLPEPAIRFVDIGTLMDAIEIVVEESCVEDRHGIERYGKAGLPYTCVLQYMTEVLKREAFTITLPQVRKLMKFSGRAVNTWFLDKILQTMDGKACDPFTFVVNAWNSMMKLNLDCQQVAREYALLESLYADQANAMARQAVRRASY